MRTKFLIFLLLANISVHAQIVNIPDTNFKKALLTYSPVIDINTDGEIQESEAVVVTTLKLNFKGITDLTGIEKFIALTDLECQHNDIVIPDFSRNKALVNLDLHGNRLTSLDLKNNTALKTLYCEENFLTALDVSNNTFLTFLWCYGNTQLLKICLTTIQLNLTVFAPNDWLKPKSAEWSTCGLNVEDYFYEHSKKTQNVFTLFGEEININNAPEGIYIYQYTDGSTQKVIKR